MRVTRAIVLVKQVPDLRTTPVGLRTDGTIDRETAGAITNPADLHALEAALQLADEVWTVSMGPVQAEHTLRETMALGAMRAILLSDRAFAGSDTWATANALAAAVAHLGGADLVVCGISALDGETGQVGPELAHRLGLPQITGCESLEITPPTLTARRIVEGGFERVRAPLPVLVTVAETGYAPRYPSVLGRRRAATATIERLGAEDIGVDPARVGLMASPTKVAHMAPAPLPDRSCRLFAPDDAGFDALVAELAELPAVATRTREAASPPATAPSADPRPGDPAILVVGEHRGGTLVAAVPELLTKAAELAPALGGGVGVILAGVHLEGEITEAQAFGADVVYVARDPVLEPYRTEPHARVLAELCRRVRPAAVLAGATTIGRDLAPRVAAMLDTGLAADCTDLAVAPWDRRGVHHDALLHQIRPAMAGGVLATCVCPEARPQMATVRPGVFTAVRRPRAARIEDLVVAFEPSDGRVEVIDRQISETDVGLADADVVIAGGAGCGARSWHLVEELADAIGGRVAASRGAVEAGLAPRALQVGQTGTSVSPQLYVACGISGALQHVVGLHGARTIVAVNSDPDALIFTQAHYGIVGEVAQVLPGLTAAFRQRS